MEPFTIFKDQEAQSKSRGNLLTIKIQLLPSLLVLTNPQQTYYLIESKDRRVSRRNSGQVDSKTKSSENKMLNFGSNF